MYDHHVVSHLPSLQYFYFLVTNHKSFSKKCRQQGKRSLSHSITFILHSGELQYSNIKFVVAPWLPMASTVGT